jgi:hypothetical protein
LIRVFVTVLRNFSKQPVAIGKVLLCTIVAIVSTFLVYGNMAAMLVNAYVMLPVDCLTNQICMIVLNFTGSYKGEFRKSFVAEGDGKDLMTQTNSMEDGGNSESIPRQNSRDSNSPKSNSKSPKNNSHSPKSWSVAFSVKSTISRKAQDAKAMLFPSSYADLDSEHQGVRSRSAPDDEPAVQAIGQSSPFHIDLSKLNDADLQAIHKKAPIKASAPIWASAGGHTPTGHFTVAPAMTPTGGDDGDVDMDADEGVYAAGARTPKDSDLSVGLQDHGNMREEAQSYAPPPGPGF